MQRTATHVHINDPECKLAINHLIRSYGFFFLHPSPDSISIAARGILDKKLLTIDHVVPVKVIMKLLMEKATTKEGVTPQFLRQFLSKHLITCLITKEENAKLNAAKLGYKLPNLTLNRRGDVQRLWARYVLHHGGIHIPRASLPAKAQKNKIIDQVVQLP